MPSSATTPTDTSPARAQSANTCVKVAASAKARTKGGFFQTIADHVGIHRRDVAGVFHVMGSMIKSDLSKNGSGVSTRTISV